MTRRRRDLPRSFDELAGLRARGLVRESTVEQGSNSGPIVQLQDEVAFAARWGLALEQRPDPETGEPVPYLYTDLVSGSDAAKRPAFQQMVADARAGAFDVLLVRDTSRFARNHEQAVAYQAELHDAGVVVAYIVEGRLSNERAGRLQLLVNHSINEEYSEKLAENVRRGFREKRFEKRKFSGSPPIGYLMEYEDVQVGGAKGHERRDTGRLLQDQRPRPLIGQGVTYTNADLVLHIGQLYATGRFGARALAAQLNLDGYRTARGMADDGTPFLGGEPFTGNGIRHLLASPTYAGLLSWHHRADKRARGEAAEPLVEGGWDPIWPEPLWRLIQDVRQRQYRGSQGGRVRMTYTLRRIAVCDRCGRRLIGEAHRAVPYMVCSTARERHDCMQMGVKAHVLEDQVGRWLATLRVPDEWKADLDRMAAGARRRREEAPPIDRSSIELQVRRLKDFYLEMQIGREEFVGRMRALEATLAGGPEQPTYFEADFAKMKALLHDWSQLWDRATPAERAGVMSAMFSEVRVRDKAIVGATLADKRYAPLIASSEAARIRLLAPGEGAAGWVGLAPPDGLGHAGPAIEIAGVRELVATLLAA